MVERTHTDAGLARAQLLSALILAFRPPTRESVDLLGAVDLKSLLTAAGCDPTPDGLRRGGDVSLSDLESEYVRLFVNARDSQVAHLEALAYLADAGEAAQSAKMLELAQSLAAAHLEPVDDARLPADHLTVLLEALLSMEGAMEASPGDHPFAERFLGGWVPEMLDRLEGAKPHPFYGAAGELLARVLGCTAHERREQSTTGASH